jgi:hypothetical protein
MPARKTSLSRPAARLRADELTELRTAYRYLEEPSFAARLTNVIGTPIEAGLRLLPADWHRRVRSAAETSIGQALSVALVSLPRGTRAPPVVHRWAVAATGAAGGFLGPLALLAELPATTVIMLRSIAAIARQEGEALDTPAGRRACLEVFALGGRSHRDDAADAGYYGLRLALAMHFTGGLERVAGEAAVPLGLKAVRAVVARFGVAVSDKVALQLVPAFGALSGALVNVAFMRHFEDVARGHFVVRRLERRHGARAVRAAYMRIAREKAAQAREFSPLEGW